MRGPGGAWPLLLAAVALGVGCDSDDPLQGGDQTMSLTFSAPGAVTPLLCVTEVFEDANGDGTPDGDLDGDGAADVGLWCQAITSGTTTTASPASVPWSFAVEVKLLRSGATVPDTILTSLGTAVNYTGYDTNALDAGGPTDGCALPATQTVSHVSGTCTLDNSVRCNPNGPVNQCANAGLGVCQVRGQCDGDPTRSCSVSPTSAGNCTLMGGMGRVCDCTLLQFGVCGPAGTCTGNSSVRCVPSCTELGAGATCVPGNVTRSFRFRSRRRLSTAHREVLASTHNPLSDTSSVGTAGICPGFDLGDVGVMGRGQPFTVGLNKGDTVFVEARQLLANSGSLNLITNPASINVRVEVDGRTVTPNGSTSASLDQTSAIDFSYSSQ